MRLVKRTTLFPFFFFSFFFFFLQELTKPTGSEKDLAAVYNGYNK
jgi:hypothetical protein